MCSASPSSQTRTFLLSLPPYSCLSQVLAKVISEFDSAHHALSEEGSIEWKLAFDRVSRFNLAPVIFLLILIICPVIFYAYIFLPCWECYDFTAGAHGTHPPAPLSFTPRLTRASLPHPATS